MSADGPCRQSVPSIDLISVRETLRYIEGDLLGTRQHAQLRTIIGLALAEIGRIEDLQSPSRVKRRGATVFVPAQR